MTCPPSGRQDMGLFKRTHLSHQDSSGFCCGPSRGLRCNGAMESISFRSGRPQGGPLSNAGVDAGLRRVPCRAVCPAVQTNKTPPKEALFISIGSMALKPFLRFRASRPGLFYDLSAGDSCPLRIPLAPSTGLGLWAAVSPTDKSGKGQRPPASHLKKVPKPPFLYNRGSHCLPLLKTDPNFPVLQV
jgi:hypothetical protein